MDEYGIPTRKENEHLFQHFLVAHDGPAYLRRARQVEQVWQAILEQCRIQRKQWLAMTRMRIGKLKALAQDWSNLQSILAGKEVEILKNLHDELQPRLRTVVSPTHSERKLRRAIVDLRESILRFNRKWLEHLPKVDLSFLNELREQYNRFYVLEKECALRSPRLAREGFVPLDPATVGDLESHFPPLVVPSIPGES